MLVGLVPRYHLARGKNLPANRQKCRLTVDEDPLTFIQRQTS